MFSKSTAAELQNLGTINFPKQQILAASELKESADNNFRFDENGRKF